MEENPTHPTRSTRTTHVNPPRPADPKHASDIVIFAQVTGWRKGQYLQYLTRAHPYMLLLL